MQFADLHIPGIKQGSGEGQCPKPSSGPLKTPPLEILSKVLEH